MHSYRGKIHEFDYSKEKLLLISRYHKKIKNKKHKTGLKLGDAKHNIFLVKDYCPESIENVSKLIRQRQKTNRKMS